MIHKDFQEALDHYVQTGIIKDHFLIAVLENDLSEALNLANETGLAQLKSIVTYIHKLPLACWGSPAQVEGWGNLSADSRLYAIERNSKMRGDQQ